MINCVYCVRSAAVFVYGVRAMKKKTVRRTNIYMQFVYCATIINIDIAELKEEAATFIDILNALVTIKSRRCSESEMLSPPRFVFRLVLYDYHIIFYVRGPVNICSNENRMQHMSAQVANNCHKHKKNDEQNVYGRFKKKERRSDDTTIAASTMNDTIRCVAMTWNSDFNGLGDNFSSVQTTAAISPSQIFSIFY